MVVDPRIRLGSRTGGYGKAKIIKSKIEGWQETNAAADLKASDVFTVTLLSHALVRDENGQFQTDICKEFESFGELDEKKTYKKAEIIGGFNRKWGLPLPQMTAVKAGSIFTFKAKRDIAATAISRRRRRQPVPRDWKIPQLDPRLAGRARIASAPTPPEVNA